MKKILTTPIGNFPVRIKLLLLVLFPTLLIASPYSRPSLLSVGSGTFDTLRPNQRMSQYQVEYKWGINFLGVQPFAGVMLTKKGSIYCCLGGCYDIFMGKYFILTPGFAPGVYFKNGGKELGFPLEFRSSIALAIQLPGHNRLGVQFYHISNASLGFKNPGEESLVVFYSIPL